MLFQKTWMDFDTNNKIPATEVFTEESTKPQIDTIDQAINTATHDQRV